MAGVALITARFDDGPIRRHLAALALLDEREFDRGRIEIGEYFVGEVQDNLQRQRLVDGSAMPQSKAAIRRKGKTLVDSGRLRDSYTYQLVPGGVEIGSAVIYAAIHHFGWDSGEKHPPPTLPARPVLGINPEGERELADIVIRALRRAQGGQA